MSAMSEERSAAATGGEDWRSARVERWCALLMSSYERWRHEPLIESPSQVASMAETVFESGRIIVSHGGGEDPIFNFGNRRALELWELSWDAFVRMPSRYSAEPDAREARERMLEQARALGFFAPYRGVRISSSGRRFVIEDAVIWSVVDERGEAVGQAATFAEYRYL
jgi:hypothetical protein